MNDTSSLAGLAVEYDIVIIGGGTAGLVLASRLTEDPQLQVLVLEAGGNRLTDPRITTPGLALSTWSDPDFDWCFETTPQEHLDGRTVAQPRGKTLGGSAAINLNLMAYPSKSDLDNWSKLGNAGWDWESMLPYYRKFHTLTPPSDDVRKLLALDYLDDAVQGVSGPIKASFGEGQGPLDAAWPETFKNLNLKMTGDHLSGLATGGHSNPGTIDPATKDRSHAGSTYYSTLAPNRANLRVLTDALAVRVLFGHTEGTANAVGVQFATADGNKSVRATQEVIVSAGAVQSPQVLELSGIGDKKLLESLRMQVVVDNPHVGENLQDHAVGHLSFEVKDGVPSADEFRDPKVAESVMALYQATKSGPLAASTFSSSFTPANGFLDTVGKAELQSLLSKYLDGQIIDDSTGYKKQIQLMRSVMETGDDSSAHYFSGPFQINVLDGHSPLRFLKPSTPGNYISIFAALSHPFARGSVHIRSADPTEKPIIDPKYLSHPLDREILARHIQFLETIAKTQPLASFLKENGRRIPPDTRVEDLNAAGEQAKLMISNFHPTGTCAMMPKVLGGVVDQRLIVHGTRNLRVVDASIIPLQPRGNILSSVYAIAEKAADLIKEDLRARSTQKEVETSRADQAAEPLKERSEAGFRRILRRFYGWTCFK